MIRHIKYESQLNDFALSHDFKRNVIYSNDLDIYDIPTNKLRTTITEYIENIIEEYSVRTGFENDLNFALSLNLKITYFILDTIEAYSEEIAGHFAIEL